MTLLSVNDLDLICFGRFYAKVIYLLHRNWVVVDLETKTSSIFPVGPNLLINSLGYSLEISWKTLGFNLYLKAHNIDTRFFCGGEIHSFNISRERMTVSVSTLEYEQKELDVINDLEKIQRTLNGVSVFETPLAGKKLKAISYATIQKSDSCMVYLHGGPFQRFTNEYNGILRLLNEEGWPIYVPQYCGDPTVDNHFIDCLPDGSLQIEQLSLMMMSLRERYKNIIVFSHSYGCYLGRKLLDTSAVDALISVNGVFDLQTLKKLSPATFRMFEGVGGYRSCGEDRKWIHFHSERDPVVSLESLYSSLKNSGIFPMKVEVLESAEHEILTFSTQKSIFQHIRAFLDEFKY